MDRPKFEVADVRSEEHTSELQSRPHLVCRLLLEKKKTSVIKAQAFSNDGAGFGFFFMLALLALVIGSFLLRLVLIPFFFFNDTATTEIYTLSLHDALPIRV